MSQEGRSSQWGTPRGEGGGNEQAGGEGKEGGMRHLSVCGRAFRLLRESQADNRALALKVSRLKIQAGLLRG